MPIDDAAFTFCSYLKELIIEENSQLSNIKSLAFVVCKINVIINNSDLKLTIGSLKNGRIAYDAYIIVDKYGCVEYKKGVTEYLIKDDFVFIKEDEKYSLIKESLDPYDKNLIVTPKDIDETIENLSIIISEGLNRSLHPGRISN